MTMTITFFNYPGAKESPKDGMAMVEKVVEIDGNATFEEVRDKLMESFGVTEEQTFGKVYLQQLIEIRELPKTKDNFKKFLVHGAFDLSDPIEVHFKRVPLLFLLYTSSKKTKRKVMHIDPGELVKNVKERVLKKFSIRPGINIELVHQGFRLPDDKPILSFKKFDPAHSLKVVAQIVEDEMEYMDLE